MRKLFFRAIFHISFSLIFAFSLFACHRVGGTTEAFSQSEVISHFQAIPEVEEVVFLEYRGSSYYEVALYLSNDRFLRLCFDDVSDFVLKMINDYHISVRDFSVSYDSEQNQHHDSTETWFDCFLSPLHLKQFLGIQFSSPEEIIEHFGEIVQFVENLPDVQQTEKSPYFVQETELYDDESKTEHTFYFFKTTNQDLFFYKKPLRANEISADVRSLPHVESVDFSSESNDDYFTQYRAKIKTDDGHSLEMLLRSAQPTTKKVESYHSLPENTLVCQFYILNYDENPFAVAEGKRPPCFENQDLYYEPYFCFDSGISAKCPSYRDLFANWEKFLEVIKNPLPMRAGGA